MRSFKHSIDQSVIKESSKSSHGIRNDMIDHSGTIWQQDCLFTKTARLLTSSRNLTHCCAKTSFHQFRYFHYIGGKLYTMKLDKPAFHAIFTPELKELIRLFDKHNYELRIAGGAVRDLLMDKVPHDIDFATTATPDQMKEMFELERVRLINMKGEKHGTITARINDKENFEVTTLRIDVVTDGRHAEVEFTKDWQLDANRRDLTINAMFLGFDGTIYDYFNGIEDLENKIIRFVGDAECRIQEDYLRILRYFRFYGRIAKSAYQHEQDTLEAIKKNSAGLKGISGERIWMELKKIVNGRFAAEIIKTMVDVGITTHIGFPSSPDVGEFLAVYELHQRLKLSNHELSIILFVVDHRDEPMGDNPLKFCQHLSIDTSGKDGKRTERICELIKYKGDSELLKQYSSWEQPKFPVSGNDLISRGMIRGPVFAKTLTKLRDIWKESDFVKTREELVEEIEDIAKQMAAEVPVKKKKKKT
ncbi:hypothetical protein KUTeg_009177 [Tegillarca granosa]|uniref:CCA tRNA nucleotidyltransferase 1, mitochondrial n=1 Tax=Tegillarca granosa TaxID=220873 RepID=A0ABQ9FC92_TEGGR|nr:hypothetical protein KUTeg_009177 [Tegillarca granosa]